MLDFTLQSLRQLIQGQVSGLSDTGFSFYGSGFGFQGFRMLVFSRMHGCWFHLDCWIFGFFKDHLDSVFYGFSDFQIWFFFGMSEPVFQLDIGVL
jgi:hypothetical protein